jgi:hypothetical protein
MISLVGAGQHDCETVKTLAPEALDESIPDAIQAFSPNPALA